MFACFLFIDISLINFKKEKPNSQVNAWLSPLSQKTHMISSCKHTKSQSNLNKLQWRYSFFKGLTHSRVLFIWLEVGLLLIKYYHLNPVSVVPGGHIWLRWKWAYSLRACVRQDSSLRIACLLCRIMTELELPAVIKLQLQLFFWWRKL